jgi:pimeloyl-ACP methyl ester carboxylesterase
MMCNSIVGDLVGLLDHIGQAEAVFAGLDFGVFAIYDLAYIHPERVRAIIALENPAYPDTPEQAPLARRRSSWRDPRAIFRRALRPDASARRPHDTT